MRSHAVALLLLAAPAAPAFAQDWDALFGGVPSGNLVTGEIGYSSVPKVAFLAPLSRDIAMGGAMAFDLGYYHPQGGSDFGLSLTAPIRISTSDSGAWSTGLKLEPGFLFQFRGEFRFNLLLNVGFSAGYRVSNQFTIGPGIEVLLAFRLTDSFAVALPILLGGALEFHARPDLALTFDLKFGPWIYGNNFSSGADFGLKVAAGVAYKF